MKQGLLKFITCGSVDNGKSTLIGHLLYEANLLYDDQRELIANNSDFAAFLDGLRSEREQGITIDVAYRYFQTAARKFIVIDCPGHEQYTRNMITGASNADYAIILIDAQQGITEQTIRHAFIVGLMGIKKILVAINKMDIIGYSAVIFDEIAATFATKTQLFQFEKVDYVPLSALLGDNLLQKSDKMPWYKGFPLLHYLENIDISVPNVTEDDFFMQIQYVNRVKQNQCRTYCGRIALGKISVDDEVTIMPFNNKVRVKTIYGTNTQQDCANSGENVSLCFDKQIDISRGHYVCKNSWYIPQTNQFVANLIWMTPRDMNTGETFLLKLGSQTTIAYIKEINYVLNINTQQKTTSKTIRFNELANCIIETNNPVPFIAYHQNKNIGGFILISRTNNETIACGMLRSNLNNTNIFNQKLHINKKLRSGIKLQHPCIIWFTGLSCSGKSTIANQSERKLYDLGKHTYLIDGDNIRNGLNSDLRFSANDRRENIRRISELAKILVDAGLIVLVAAISPFQKERNFAKSLVTQDEFIEVFVNTPLHVCEQRDTKGLYKEARSGKISLFTGISSPYEPPEKPDITINTTQQSVDDAVMAIINHYLQLN